MKIYTAIHPVPADERIYTDKSGRSAIHTQTVPVMIGNNVRIRGGVIILPCVTIGDNAVVGAGSMVTKSIPTNDVACGNPCKVKKVVGTKPVGDNFIPHIDITMISGRDDTAKKEIAVKVQQFLVKEE